MIVKFYNIEWLDESFLGIPSTMIFRLLLKPYSFIMGQMLDPTVDYCQLLLYTRYTNSAIVRSIRG